MIQGIMQACGLIDSVEGARVEVYFHMKLKHLFDLHYPDGQEEQEAQHDPHQVGDHQSGSFSSNNKGIISSG